jgi:hypothetical protein
VYRNLAVCEHLDPIGETGRNCVSVSKGWLHDVPVEVAGEEICKMMSGDLRDDEVMKKESAAVGRTK